MTLRILLAVLAVLLLAMGWSFAPLTLPARELSVAELPVASPPPEMSVSVLPTAEVHSVAALAVRGGSFGEPRVFSQTAMLVRHPRGDLLFDTGLGEHGREHLANSPFLMRSVTTLDMQQPAAQRLQHNGYDPRRLAGIVPTHAHWDHISGVPDFPETPIWLNDSERAFIASGDSLAALMRSFGALDTHRYAFEEKPYLGFARSLDVWGDGAVVIVPAPGHTPGSILVFLTLPSQRRLVLLGDLVWAREGIERPAERPWLSRQLVDNDAAQVREVIAQMAALHRRFPALEMLPAHDARAWAELPVFPASAR